MRLSVVCVLCTDGVSESSRVVVRALPRSAVDRGQIAAKTVQSADRRGDRERSFHMSQHLRQHLTSFTRHCAKTDHAELTHYAGIAGALQLYGVSISRHCALCCYLGDTTCTAPWSCQRDRQRSVSGDSISISMSNAAFCVCV